MKKNGFTLAEVLVALGIVGVLSAMTAPTLIKNNQNLVYAKTLSTAVSDFEIAMNAMITRENVSNLHETPAWEDIGDFDAFVENLSEIMNLEESNSNSNAYYDDDDGNINILNSANTQQSSTVFGGNAFTLVTTKGIVYHIRPISSENQNRTDFQAMMEGVNLTRIAAWVFIDVNGNQRPNRTGRDIFGFILGNDGIMYPLGGRDAAFFLDNNAANIWSTDASTYTCTNAVKDNFALGCTARLIDNNYRIDY